MEAGSIKMQNPSTFQLRCCQHFLPVSFCFCFFICESIPLTSLSQLVCLLSSRSLSGWCSHSNKSPYHGWGFRGGASSKNPPANAGDRRHGSVPGLGKIPWGRAWQPTPVFLPGQRSLVPTVHRAAKSQTRLK